MTNLTDIVPNKVRLDLSPNTQFNLQAAPGSNYSPLTQTYTNAVVITNVTTDAYGKAELDFDSSSLPAGFGVFQLIPQ